MQTISLGNPFINLKGEWKEDVEYEYLDAVTNRGSLFIANKRFVPAGTVPGKDNAWLLSARGEDEEITKELIRNSLSEHEKLSTKDGVHDFPEYKEGQLLTVKEGELAFTNDYRIPITKNTTWYVRADGDDANDGSEDTPEKAFKTIQRCLDYICDRIYPSRYKVFIQVGAGTFAGFYTNCEHMSIPNLQVCGKSDGTTILSNKGMLSNILIDAYGFTSIGLKNLVLDFDDSYVPNTRGCQVIRVANGTYAYFDTSIKVNIKGTKNNITFLDVYSNSKFRNNTGTSFVITSSASAKTFNIFNISFHSEISFDSGCTIDISGEVTNFIKTSTFSYASLASVSFSGTLTGKRYSAETSSIIHVAGKGTNFLPGTVAGTLASGATYY